MLPGVLFLFLGLIMICATKNDWSKKKNLTYGVGIYFVVFGLLLFLFDFQKREMLVAYTLCIGMGCIFIGVFLWNIRKRFTCSQKCRGTFMGCQSHRNPKGGTRFSPVFRYTWGKKSYQLECGETFSGRYIRKRYVQGETYDIYVDPKEPMFFITTKAIPLINWGMALMGVYCFGLLIYISK